MAYFYLYQDVSERLNVKATGKKKQIINSIFSARLRLLPPVDRRSSQATDPASIHIYPKMLPNANQKYPLCQQFGFSYDQPYDFAVFSVSLLTIYIATVQVKYLIFSINSGSSRSGIKCRDLTSCIDFWQPLSSYRWSFIAEPGAIIRNIGSSISATLVSSCKLCIWC